MMQLFDELTEPPNVGKYYLVRCVKGWWGYPYRESMWPVWGPKHDDAKHLDYPWPHYHVNRFFVQEDEIMNATRAPLSEQIPQMSPLGNNKRLAEPVLRRRKCRWASDKIRFPLELAQTGKPIWRNMYRHFSGMQCKRGNGWICPHKGFDLGAMAPAADGVIICPLHGVRVLAETGVVMP